MPPRFFSLLLCNKLPNLISKTEFLIGGLFAAVEILEIKKCLCGRSMERELHTSRKVLQALLKISKALMERLTKWKNSNSFLVRLEEYTFSFLAELDEIMMMMMMMMMT